MDGDIAAPQWLRAGDLGLARGHSGLESAADSVDTQYCLVALALCI